MGDEEPCDQKAVSNILADPKLLTQRLHASLPTHVLAWLTQAIEAAQIAGIPIYLVGGPVRDLLLGHPTVDLDLVVEGDAWPVAERFAERTGGKLTRHAAFRTATVELQFDGEPFAIDVVTARCETYPRPAALPAVNPSNIHDDLFRRDFTINAMALRLDHDPTLLDPYDGRRDLEQRLVRILHDRSFLDDPTRILRAARFVARLGFALDRHTYALLQAALLEHMIEQTSPQRILHELWLLLAEPRPEQVLIALHEWNALPSLGLVWSSAWIDHFGTARALNMDDRTRRLVCWGLIVWPLDEAQRRALAERYNLPAAERRLLQDLPTAVPDALLQAYLDPQSLDRMLRRYDAPTLRTMEVAAPPQAAEHIAHYLDHIQSLSPLLTGADLRELGIPPGPRYGQLLEQARQEQIAGTIRTHEEAYRWIRQQIANGST